MRILFISNHLRGGANRALWRHFQEIRNQGIEAHILIGVDERDLPDHVVTLPALAAEHYGRQHTTLEERIAVFAELDIVQKANLVEFRSLHNGGRPDVLSVEMIRLAANLGKPVVWRLSDMWAFTGFCAYSFDCKKWVSLCSECPQLEGPDENKRELRPPSQPIGDSFRQKKAIYTEVADKLNIVCPSQWMLENARTGILSQSASFTHIPVGIELDIYRPASKARLRTELNLPFHKTLVAACIANTRNYRKAADLLWQVAERLPPEETALLLIGSGEVRPPESLAGLEIFTTPFLQDPDEQARWYAAADLFCFTSRYDNSAQTLGEAAACGLPTVCFEVGGNPEYVLDGITGAVVPPYETEAMAAALVQLGRDSALRFNMSRKAVEKAVVLCGMQEQTRRYIEFYQKLLPELEFNSILGRSFIKSGPPPMDSADEKTRKRVLIFSPNTGGHRHLYAYRFVEALSDPSWEIYFAHAGIKSGLGHNQHDSIYLEAILSREDVRAVLIDPAIKSGQQLKCLREIQDRYQIDSTLILDGDVLLPSLSKALDEDNPPELSGRNFALFILSEFLYTNKKAILRGLSQARLRYLYFRYFDQSDLLDGLFVSDENIVQTSGSSKFFHLPDITQPPPLGQLGPNERDFESRTREQIEAFLQRHPDKQVVLCFGDMEKRKGYIFLLRLVTEFRDLVLLRVGRTKPGYSPDWEELRLKEALMIEDRMLAIDCYIPNPQFLFDKIEFILLPYVKFYRTSGVMLDAASHLLPMLVPDIGLIGHRVRHHGIGLTFRHLDYADFKRNFLQLRHRAASFHPFLREFAKLFAEPAFRATARTLLGENPPPSVSGDRFSLGEFVPRLAEDSREGSIASNPGPMAPNLHFHPASHDKLPSVHSMVPFSNPFLPDPREGSWSALQRWCRIFLRREPTHLCLTFEVLLDRSLSNRVNFFFDQKVPDSLIQLLRVEVDGASPSLRWENQGAGAFLSLVAPRDLGWKAGKVTRICICLDHCHGEPPHAAELKLQPATSLTAIHAYPVLRADYLAAEARGSRGFDGLAYMKFNPRRSPSVRELVLYSQYRSAFQYCEIKEELPKNLLPSPQYDERPGDILDLIAHRLLLDPQPEAILVDEFLETIRGGPHFGIARDHLGSAGRNAQVILVSGHFSNGHPKLRFFEALNLHLQSHGMEICLLRKSYNPLEVSLPSTVIPKSLFDLQKDLDALEKVRQHARTHKTNLILLLDQVGTVLNEIYRRLYLDFLHHLHEQLDFRAALLWHQFNHQHLLLKEFCDLQEIPYLFVEHGSLPHTIGFDAVGQMGESRITTEAGIFKQLPVSEADLETAERILAYCRNARIARHLSGRRKAVDSTVRAAREAGRKIIFYAGQNDLHSGTGPAHFRFFRDTLDALDHLAFLAERHNWLILFKPHPFMEDYHQSPQTPFPDRVAVTLDADIISYIDAADVCVTILSQAAYLFLIHQKPSLLLGRMQLSHKACLGEPGNRAEVETHLLQALKEGLSSPRKKAFVHHIAQLCRYHLYPLNERVAQLLQKTPEDAAEAIVGFFSGESPINGFPRTAIWESFQLQE